jgi:dephospho-CoA kinase
MQKLIIDIVGLAGSGKSRLCSFLAETYGFELYRPSDALRKYAKLHGRELNGRQDYIDIHHELIENDPMAIIEPVIVSTATKICLDGMRAPLPFLELREKFGAHLIYLDCPDEIRLQRMQNDTSRDAHRQPPTMESLLADEAPDMQNPNRNLPNMVEMKQLAEYSIDASKPFDEVQAQTREFINQLLISET